MEMHGPDPKRVYPNPALSRVVFLKNVVRNPNIRVGEYTYYDDPDGAEDFERHVTHHYPFLGDKLIIGKFCAIARGVEFVMNGANHSMCSVHVPVSSHGRRVGKGRAGAFGSAPSGGHGCGQRRMDRAKRHHPAGRADWRRGDHRRQRHGDKGCARLPHRRRQPGADSPGALFGGDHRRAAQPALVGLAA